MPSFALFCKSYSTDLNRLVRLARSVQEFNQERIPFHVSVPRAELPLFSEKLRSYDLTLHADEDIMAASGHAASCAFAELPGHLGQQVVKAEFWRLNLFTSYLCLDSDAVFIRAFGRSDFLAEDGTPYTVIDEGHELLEAALRKGKHRAITSFREEAAVVQRLIGRVGRAYNFGPLPVVWHRAVWESLDREFLEPQNMTFVDAIVQAPSEARWYGEALLKYSAVPLLPAQSHFKVYHYAWQYDQDRGARVSHSQLANIYLGVIRQSAWERELDWPAEGGGLGSRTARRLRRLMGRI